MKRFSYFMHLFSENVFAEMILFKRNVIVANYTYMSSKLYLYDPVYKVQNEDSSFFVSTWINTPTPTPFCFIFVVESALIIVLVIYVMLNLYSFLCREHNEPVSLDCPFLIAPSFVSIVHIQRRCLPTCI